MSGHGMRSMKILRAIAIAWSALLIAFIGSGVMSTQRIGALTFGPVFEFWSLTIAISSIEHGAKGRIGYLEVLAPIVEHLTANNSEMAADPETHRRVRQPDLVTGAIRAAAAVKSDQLRHLPKEQGGYVTALMDDVGYADFYELAFRIFGYSAYSSYHLYTAMLAISFGLFVIVYRRDNVPIGAVTLAVNALFLLSASEFFSEYIPSLAVHRLLSTLTFIPLLHAAFAALALRPLRLVEVVVLALQTAILVFAIWCRSAGGWALIAFVAIALVGVVIRWFGMQQATPRSKFKAVLGSRPSQVLLIFLGAAFVVNSIQNARLDDIYFSDDVMPHHGRWHSGYLGLMHHPDWEKVKPFAELPPDGDMMSFRTFEIIMRQRGLPATSALARNSYRMRVHEAVIREVFLGFLKEHPRFVFELYFHYKPVSGYVGQKTMVGWIPASTSALAAIALALSVCLFGANAGEFHRGETTVAFLILWLCSQLPPMWAYYQTPTMADQLWSLVFFGPFLLAMVVGWVFSVGLRMQRARPATPAVVPVESR